MTVGRARAPAATLSRLSVVVVVIRAGPGLVVARVHVWTMRACTRARDTRLRVGGRVGYIRIRWTYRNRASAIRLPIQHVQPSTCADTINQIN